MNTQVPVAEKAQPTEIEDIQHSVMMMVTALVFYTKEGKPCQRHINIMLSSATGNVRKEDLQSVNVAAMNRLKAENDVDHDNILDIVILNICPLGWMTQAEFYGNVEG